MPFILLTVFIAVPLLEIAVFIEVGSLIGLWPTLGAVVATAVAGTWLLRLQGLSTLRRARTAVERGELPLGEVFDGACLLVAGVLLLTPGFVTDTMGLLLFLPPVRAGLRRLIGRHMELHVVPRPTGSGNGDDIIEGDWEEVREPPPAVERRRR